MPLKQLLKSVWLYGWAFIVILALFASIADLLLLGGIRLFLAMITGHLADVLGYVHDKFSLEWLHDFGILHWILLMLAVVAMRYLVITLRARSEERLNRKMEGHLRAWWIRTVKRMHPSNFHRGESEDALHSANLSIGTLSKGCKIITQSVQAISQLLFFLPVLFWISWQLSMVLIFIFTPIVLYLQKSLKNANLYDDDLNDASGSYNSNLWRWTVLRRYWNNQRELSKYLSLLFEKIRSLKTLSTKIGVREATVMQNIETLSILIMCIVLAACAVFIRIGAMEPVQIVLFCAALFICYKPLKDCSQLFPNIRDLRIAYAGLHKLENMENADDFIEETNEEFIKIEEVDFRYRIQEPWLFKSLSNSIRLNRPVILQGENGSGKTTLLRILSGLEIPHCGSIFMPPRAKEGTFYLSQRLFLPPVSWLGQAINEKEWSANIQKLFEVLSLESLLKKSGHSNGELQRLGLAWAVTSGVPFLFLDEPFAFIAQSLKEPIFKAFWNATTETDQWWMMASHELPPAAYQERVSYWKLEKPH
ncbi:MAG: ATP-binding cassette domain-containing protein [Fibromonadaceae bacterium]|jgi:ABC-type multidrug transport system fused ATPase/permease subunit|nr:ATP-binding cassette domain-containing protein [Fibromonadaceae bacterium]